MSGLLVGGRLRLFSFGTCMKRIVYNRCFVARENNWAQHVCKDGKRYQHQNHHLNNHRSGWPRRPVRPHELARQRFELLIRQVIVGTRRPGAPATAGAFAHVEHHHQCSDRENE